MRIFAVGDRVTQPQYGAGTVTSANTHHTIIDFDEHGVRTFVTSMVSLEATSNPAPPRNARAKSRRRTTPSA
jgi:RNA polymerase-interacting CarD/CdnL/TRCF family regulator